MPRMDNVAASDQLVKLLLIGDGKCGKTDFAGMAAADGFNILYMDGDVGAQTIATLPIEARRKIYLMPCGDQLSDSGSLVPTYTGTVKKFISSPTLVWNDSRARLHTALDKDADLENDEFWLIRPSRMDWTSILVLEWTALVNSTMAWAAEEHGVDLAEVDERGKMRSVYQSAGEKLTQYLLMIQRCRMHVIVLSHPAEFVKTKRPDGKTVKETKEGDLKTLWTKMVPKSCSNNHALTMAKYFTDVAWLEPDAMGNRVIDFRIDREKISGGHFNDKFQIRNRDQADKSGFSFADLVKKIGGTVPDRDTGIDHWLTIQTGYEAPGAKKAATLVVPKATTPSNSTVSAPAAVSQVKGLAGLAGLKQRGPAKV